MKASFGDTAAALLLMDVNTDLSQIASKQLVVVYQPLADVKGINTAKVSASNPTATLNFSSQFGGEPPVQWQIEVVADFETKVLRTKIRGTISGGGGELAYEGGVAAW